MGHSAINGLLGQLDSTVCQKGSSSRVWNQFISLEPVHRSKLCENHNLRCGLRLPSSGARTSIVVLSTRSPHPTCNTRCTIRFGGRRPCALRPYRLHDVVGPSRFFTGAHRVRHVRVSSRRKDQRLVPTSLFKKIHRANPPTNLIAPQWSLRYSDARDKRDERARKRLLRSLRAP